MGSLNRRIADFTGQIVTRATLSFVLNGGLDASVPATGDRISVTFSTPANFASADPTLASEGRWFDANPAQAMTLSLMRLKADGSAATQVGTITIGTEGSVSFASTNGNPVAWGVGDFAQVTTTTSFTGTLSLTIRGAIG